ncbi:MAG: hypothetical protein WHT09_09290 [Thermogutta sp.]|jgi:hypothetical protein
MPDLDGLTRIPAEKTRCCIPVIIKPSDLSEGEPDVSALETMVVLAL